MSKVKISFSFKSEGTQWKYSKSRYFSMGHIQIWHHLFCIRKYFNDSQNQNFLVLWQSEPKQWKLNKIRHFSTHSNLMFFFRGRKILKYLNKCYDWHFSISLYKWLLYIIHKQVTWNKITRDMCKSDSIIPYLQISTLFSTTSTLKLVWLLKFISW